MTYKPRTGIDFHKYRPEIAGPEVKYGLPQNVEFCWSCVMSNQRPNAVIEYEHNAESEKSTLRVFDDHICSACKVTLAKESVDWDERERELREICDRFRRNDGRHDCIVPGSGGKDSFYAAHILKHKYGMHPLTITWAPHAYTDWGWRNFQAWIHAGFDNVLITPNGRVHRLLTRLAVENIFHPFQPFIIGQKMIAAKLSVLHDIPLVFFGEPASEHGQPPEEEVRGTYLWDFFTTQGDQNTYIGGTSLEDLYESFGLEPNDLEMYLPIDPEKVERANTTVYWLGYYEKWHPQGAYYYAVENSDWRPAPERTPGTYNKFQSIDDKIDDLHYYSTFIKFGIGRTTYEASVDVRHGDLTRNEAISLVKRYDGEYPKRFENELFAYLSIPENQFPKASKRFEQPVVDADYFRDLTDAARSPHLWVYESGTWRLRHQVENLDVEPAINP